MLQRGKLKVHLSIQKFTLTSYNDLVWLAFFTIDPQLIVLQSFGNELRGCHMTSQESTLVSMGDQLHEILS